MQLTCLRLGGNTEHDADYETAVDLRRYTIDTEQALYELPSGARLVFERVAITTTATYLEPAFNHYEATGITVYLQHDNEEFGTEIRTRACLYGLIPVRHGDDNDSRFSELSNGWEAAISFAPQDLGSLESWSVGEVVSIPDNVVTSLIVAYNQRVSDNWQAFLDSLVSMALERIDASVAHAYDMLGLLGEAR